jgi:hypothetical protein
MATWTWNPSDKYAAVTLSGGNLTASTAASTQGGVRATASKAVNKWYWEIAITTVQAGSAPCVGIGTSSASLSQVLGYDVYGWAWQANGFYRHNNSFASAGVSLVDGDVAQIALDLDDGKLWFGKNGTWNASGNPATGANPIYTGVSGTIFPIVFGHNLTALTVNFGASAFSYTEPSGFTGISITEGSTTETAEATDTMEALHLVDAFSESAAATDSMDALHLVDSISESAAATDAFSRSVEVTKATTESAEATDTFGRNFEVERSITESAVATDSMTPLHLVDVITESATASGLMEADDLIRKKIRFPNLQGKHLSLKFTSATDGSFAIYYLRHKMFKTRELCSDQKHPNTQGSHIGIKLSNSGSDEFILMYVSEKMQLVTT